LYEHRLLHSFPTRRSSDLFVLMLKSCGDKTTMGKPIREINSPVQPKVERTKLVGDTVSLDEEPDTSKYYYGLYTVPVVKKEKKRSEEHTSELQSRENLVCR